MAMVITLSAGELTIDDGPSFNLATCTKVDIEKLQQRTPYEQPDSMLYPTPDSGVTLAGAGTSAVNGSYSYQGLYNGKAWYAKVNGTNTGNPLTSTSVYFASAKWHVGGTSGQLYYQGTNTSTPWGATWTVDTDGTGSAPTVTEAPFAASQVGDTYYILMLTFNDLSQLRIPMGDTTTIGGSPTTNSLAGAEAARDLIKDKFV